MVNITEIKNRLGNGCTVPYVVWCDDGNTYIVKFPGNIQGKKTLVNEFIASRIAEYLELPILKYELINVKVSDYRNDMKEDIDLICGTCFGTIYDSQALTILNAGNIIKSKNRNDAVKILIFDVLMGNLDRNKGNLLINSVTKNIIMIDHTHIFELGTIWDEHQLPRLTTENFDFGRLHQFNYQNIVNSFNINSEFISVVYEFAKKVENISRKYIDDIMNDIPKDWDTTELERKLLADFIEKRFKRVNEILVLLNLKGGDNSEK